MVTGTYRGISGDVAGEDGGIDDEEIVGAIDLGVSVDDGGAASESAVRSHLRGSDPMVRATGCGSKRQRLDVVASSDVGSGDFPDNLGDLGDRLLEVLDAGDDGLEIGFGLEVRGLGNEHAQSTVDGE